VNYCPGCGAALRGAGGRARRPSSAFLNQVIADRYRLLALIGEGGMGSVYKAEHIRMGKALALKILRGAFAREEGAAARFLAEAQIVSRLSHPHTIGVFDFGEIEDGEGFYLAMEYVPGQDLAQLLKASGPLPEARAAEIGGQILGSLAEAHDAGIVHRDMKPGNVMLMQTRSGEDFVKVLDFGIAKLRDERGAATTSAGAIVGTPNYLAPEQARGGGVDLRSDLYSVGCVLYELVAGRPPFVAPNPMAIVSAHLSHEPPPLGALAPRVSRRFAEIVHRALRKKPADRFASADEMRDALLALAEPEGARPSAGGPPPELTGGLEIARREDFRAAQRQVRALRRTPAWPLALLLAALVAAGGAWRWAEIHALVAARLPRLAAVLPPALRPPAGFDGVEHEPNELPLRANPLPLPPAAELARGAAAVVRGHVGARIDASTGDVDLFRVEVPPQDGPKLLVAEWKGEEGEGIRALDVVLALNRAPPGGAGPAPLVRSVNRGGPGAPERLAAAIEPGTYFLAVREHHDEATGPVEKPTDRYVLSVSLADPVPGEEVEPNDAPLHAAEGQGSYAAWRLVAERNPLAPGTPLRAESAPDDPDTLAIAPTAERADAVALVPHRGVALEARLWAPEDVAAAESGGGFEEPLAAGPGAVLFARLPPARASGAPALVAVRATDAEGGYVALALAGDAASGALVLARARALADEGRTAAALELAAGYAELVPEGAARVEALVLAGKIAEAAAARLSPADVALFDRAAHLLGDAIFGADERGVRYEGAFEARVVGAEGRLAEEARLRAVRLVPPCTPDEVVARADAFLARSPPPAADLALTARVLRARAIEEAFWTGGGADQARREAALAAWRDLAASGGDAAGEAAARVGFLTAGAVPAEAGAAAVCP
jgi:serine/threonine-protein kinase